MLDAKSGSRVIAEAGSMLGILGRSRIRAPFRTTNTSQTIDTTQGNHILLADNLMGMIKTFTLRQTTAPIPEEGEWMLLVADNNVTGAVAQTTTLTARAGRESLILTTLGAGLW